MRAYELMFIIDGDVEDSAVAPVLNRVIDLAKANGAEIRSTDSWGRRRFAYEINKKWDGTYVVVQLLAEGGALDDFERTMRIADDIVRHKLIRLPEREAERRGLTPAATA